MRIVGGIIGILCGSAAAYAAEPFNNDVAKTQLFKLKGRSVELVPHDFLTDKDNAILEQVAESQLYYAAIAASPDDGILNKATVAAANHHSIEIAGAEAIKACNDLKTGAAGCVVVAYVRPKGWEPRDVQMSHDATSAWRDDYRRARGEKAFAVSPSTGKFSAAKGDGAADLATSSCNDLAETTDCHVILAD